MHPVRGDATATGGGERDPGAADRAGALEIERVAVVGCSGSGKTTLAAALAGALGAPHVELDSIYHQPGWTPLGDEEFRTRVGEATARDRWVVDGNYSVVHDIVWRSADTIVWLDLPYATVLSRTIRADAAADRDPGGAVERQPGALLEPLVAQPGEVDHRLGGDPARPLLAGVTAATTKED